MSRISRASLCVRVFVSMCVCVCVFTKTRCSLIMYRVKYSCAFACSLARAYTAQYTRNAVGKSHRTWLSAAHQWMMMMTMMMVVKPVHNMCAVRLPSSTDSVSFFMLNCFYHFFFQKPFLSASVYRFLFFSLSSFIRSFVPSFVLCFVLLLFFFTIFFL